MSQDSSQIIPFPRSIAVSQKVVYSAGAGVVTKVNHRNIKASSFTIAMQVNAVVVFVCIRR